jgi:hypothetical protein
MTTEIPHWRMQTPMALLFEARTLNRQFGACDSMPGFGVSGLK